MLVKLKGIIYLFCGKLNKKRLVYNINSITNYFKIVFFNENPTVIRILYKLQEVQY